MTVRSFEFLWFEQSITIQAEKPKEAMMKIFARVAGLTAVLVLSGQATAFAGGTGEPGAGAAAATAAESAGTEIVEIAGRYTWPKSWLETPTASQLGITSFNEAPMLAAAVSRGELPPIEERLPDDPLVVAPYESIGSYGGTLRVARRSPRDFGDMARGKLALLFLPDPTTGEVVPSLAAGHEISADNRVVTIHLRPGVKWSDGHPFTAEDIVWHYAHRWQDERVPHTGHNWHVDGKLAEMTKTDDYTVQIIFPRPVPNAHIKNLLNFARGQSGKFFAPAHFMEQFHIEFNPNADQLAKDQGYDNWPALFEAALDTDPKEMFIKPELSTWVMESRDAQGKYHVRNPYYWAVDTAGNQLPYIDRMEAVIFSNSEVAILSMMQGNIHIGGRLTDPDHFPLYRQNETIGNYRVLQWQDTKNARMGYKFNLNHKDPVLREIFRDVRFRRAMSIAINREEINEFAMRGLGIPQQMTIDSGVPFYQESWATSYAQYDVDGARRLLDEIGLRDTDGDGVRERPDGEPLVLEFIVPAGSVVGTMGVKVSELVADYWRDVGVGSVMRQLSEAAVSEAGAANELDLAAWVSRRDIATRVVPMNFERKGIYGYALLWDQWLDHQQWIAGGSQGNEPPAGEEPPPEWKRFAQLQDEWRNAMTDEEYNRLGTEFWQMYADLLPFIGTVGKVVRPIIVHNSIQNVPQTLPFGYETMLWTQASPEQWFMSN